VSQNINEDIPGDEELRDVPVFPLPKLVLFPETNLPLHLFEPRYRELMADCIASGNMLLAIAQLQPGWRADYHGRPPFYDVAGLGRITRHRKNDDGTYDIHVRGLCRVSLRELPAEDTGYRRAQATLLREKLPAGGVAHAEMSALLSLATQIVQRVKQNDASFELLASPKDEPARFIDKIADQLVPDPDARQQILETLDVRKRLELTSSKLAALHLALLANAPPDDGGGEPGLLH
jgi:Lon protease-like protein